MAAVAAVPSRRRGERAIDALLLFAFVLTAYLYHVQYRPYGGAGLDSAPAEYLPINLLEGRGFTFERYVTPGEPLPWYFTESRGRIISSYPIVPGLLNVPVFLAARVAGIPLLENRYLLSNVSASIITAISAVFLYLALRASGHRRRISVVASLAFALGTTAFSMAARAMWQHGPSLLFLALAYWLTLRGDRWTPLAGTALGFAVFTRPTNALLAMAVAAYVFRFARRDFWRFLACAAPPAALMAWYSQKYWGSVLALGQYSVTSGPYRFSGDFFQGLPGLLVSPSRGLFILKPMFLFSVPPAVRALRDWRSRSLLPGISVATIALICLYAKWYSWWGSLSFGYRIITEVTPGLALLLAAELERMADRGRLARAACAVSIAASIYVHGLSAYFWPVGFNEHPNDINRHTERLWSWTDSDLVRLQTRMWSQVSRRF